MKFSTDVTLIDLEVRNSFGNNATTSNIKYSIKFNYYSIQDIIINPKQVDDSYLRYNDRED